jgi:3'-5' exoribonuclease
VKKNIFANDITRENIDVNDLFVVSKKNIFTGKNNAKYMSVELRDRTGTIEGKVWENVEQANKLFEKSDVVSVRARSKLYQDKPQLTITDIRKIEEIVSLDDLRAFFPEAGRGIDSLKKDYFKLLTGIEDPHIASAFSALAGRNDLMERFFSFPASIGVHHTYLGGLLEHSLSMANMGGYVADIVGAHKDIIIAGCFLHDIGKVNEMEVRGGFKYSDRGRLLGHITLGVILFEELIKELKEFPKHIADILTHIIVSHHGVEEWGSPKKPMSIEALVVHYLDDLDAKVMGVKEHMRENMADEKWTEFHKLYESRFYKLPERQ